MSSSLPSNPLRIVCISDTHNTRPILPPGDIIIHSGDLTENGSFEEVQAELKWLSNQPHQYKILVAGNHDVLFDDTFLEKYPERRYGQSKTKADLDWGNVVYLEDSCITLDFTSTGPAGPALGVEDATPAPQPRRLTIFGSPWTPQYGISAFQYRPDDECHWSTRFASLDTKPDIVVTHCPPKHHLDARDFHRAGCPYLAEEIAHVRPRLVVFGHIHVSYGREDVVLDGVQRAYEEIMTGWAGWTTVAWMAILVLWDKLKRLVLLSKLGERTTFANAAVVGGPKNALFNEPIVVEL
ncbi:Fc.00g057870.m01.CDS01 [Cosmosporella sp. VM-42]